MICKKRPTRLLIRTTKTHFALFKESKATIFRIFRTKYLRKERNMRNESLIDSQGLYRIDGRRSPGGQPRGQNRYHKKEEAYQNAHG
jgi:hypothetical protein